MKIVRYIILVFLAYQFITTLAAYIYPYPIPADNQSLALMTEFIRAKLLPLVFFMGTALIGWYFIRQRVIALVASVICLGLLAYMTYDNCLNLGFTAQQSLSALINTSNGRYVLGWALFYLAILMPLMISAVSHVSKRTDERVELHGQTS